MTARGIARKLPSKIFIETPIGPYLSVFKEIPRTDSPPTLVTPLPSNAL